MQPPIPSSSASTTGTGISRPPIAVSRQALLPMVNSADLPDREEMLLMLDYLRPMYMTNRFVQRQLVRQYDQWLAALWPGELRDYYRGIAGEFIDWLESFRL